MARAETLLTEISGREPEVVAARSARRATARRASRRRAIARSRRVDAGASIINFLAQHPGSTTSHLAKGLNLDRQIVSACLAQLLEAGEIKKVSHGYQRRVRAPIGAQASERR